MREFGIAIVTIVVVAVIGMFVLEQYAMSSGQALSSNSVRLN